MRLDNQKDWKELAKLIAAEGIVLLKNDNHVLPIAEDETIAMFGGGQFQQNRPMDGVAVSIDAIDLAEAFEKEGIKVDQPLAKHYADWNQIEADKSRKNSNFKGYGAPEMHISTEMAQEVYDRGVRKAFITFFRCGGENEDVDLNAGGYLLTQEEIHTIRTVSAVFDQVVLMLHTGCLVDLSILDECKIDGLVFLNLLGEIGSVSTAKIVKGEINPSGKLPMSVAKTYADYPSSETFGQHGGGIFQDYIEDIYVGYRYFDNFNDKNLLFPFGYGLSYTSFEVGNLVYRTEPGRILVSAEVKNTGICAGKEVVQLYYGAPTAADGAILCAPPKQLCGFEKTKRLNPGESQRIEFALAIDDMASFDDLGVLGESSCYVMEKGEYKIFVGTHSRDLSLAGVHTENEHRVIRRVHELETTLAKRLNGYGEYDILPEPQYSEDKFHGISAISESVFTTKQSTSPNLESFRELKAGEKIVFQMLPGVGGEYFVAFCKNGQTVDASGLFELTIKEERVSDWKLQSDSRAKFLIPPSRFQFVLTAKADAPDIDSMIWVKRDARIAIDSEKENVLEVTNVYEMSFLISIYDCADSETGELRTCVSDFYRAGSYVTYQLDVAEEGDYDISFEYLYSHETAPLSKVISAAVSNIVQPLCGEPLEQTSSFKTSPKSRIHLPSGIAYLKIVVENAFGLSIAGITIEKSTGVVSDMKELQAETPVLREDAKPNRLDDMTGVEKVGIQLCDVYQDPNLMDAFLSQMSHRELATIVSGTGLNATPTGDVGCSSPVPERGVPAGQTADGPCGLRQVGHYPTSYPATNTLAATFNQEIYDMYGVALANECKSYDVDYWLGPGVNILRNPVGGRNFAYYSEDPYLSGMAATGVIIGLQRNGVVPVLKHYAANNTEYERLKSNSRVSARALREIYLKAFEVAIKFSNPAAIMTGYNLINDVNVCEDPVLITDVARKEWGWDGVFFTDWWNNTSHVQELKAGHDLKMATGEIDAVTEALDAGELTREQVEASAKRMIRMLFKLDRVQKLMEKECRNR